MQKSKNKCCRWCKRVFTPEELAARKIARAENIKKSIAARKAAGTYHRVAFSREKIMALWKADKTKAEIMEEIGCSKTVVDKIIRQRERRKNKNVQIHPEKSQPTRIDGSDRNSATQNGVFLGTLPVGNSNGPNDKARNFDRGRQEKSDSVL